VDQRSDKPTYPTGLKTLDDLLWGLHKKELLIMGARTSQGKSSLALQFALSLASQGQKVAYFSLEMSKEQLVERMIAYHTRINNRAIRHGLAKIQLRQHYDSLRKYSQGLKLLIDEGGYQFEEIVEVCELLKFDFVFIDYIQMVSMKGYRSKLEAIDEYVRKFKELAKVLDFGGIIVSQVNREGADHMGIQHLKGSGTLEEHPDTVLLMEWDWDAKTYTIRVEKQRHGECGKVEVCYEPEYFAFSDISGTARVLPPVPTKLHRAPPPTFGYDYK
jgi:replicative DNA helicase